MIVSCSGHGDCAPHAAPPIYLVVLIRVRNYQFFYNLLLSFVYDVLIFRRGLHLKTCFEVFFYLFLSNYGTRR